jgi:hypothetical protein
MMRKVLKNAAIGATSSSAGVLLFFAIRRVIIDVPYVWSWAMLAALCYGWLAVGLSIYGKGSVTPYKWKNGLLGVAILAGVEAASLITDRLVGAPAETSIAVPLAALISMAVSDALA